MDSRNPLVFNGEISSPKKKEKLEQSEEYFSKWSELPDEITETIIDRLGFPDILRFGSVCMPWRSVSLETLRRRSLSSRPYNPMVLFEYNLEKGTFGFFSFEESRVYWLNIEGSPAAQCIGCSKGWLVMLSPNHTYCFLLNPFTGIRIDLPYLNKPKVDDFSKVILISNPLDISSKTMNFHCTVVALNLSTELNICSLGELYWTVMKVDDHGQIIYSPIFHKGEVYSLAGIDELWILNLAAPKPESHKCKVSFPEEDIVNGHEYYIDCYLVASEDNLLMVLRLKTKTPIKTVKFMIYKLVENHHKGNDSKAAEYIWERELFLADDQALFVGNYVSISVSTTECRGLQGNSIYFTDDKLPKSSGPDHEYPETGIYKVESGDIVPYLPFNLYPFDMPHIWITPSI
ncbi:F-box/kelch-repeat protein KIB1-like [Macadamia integrifolia]|uniref:F-box/kelch-repeat protein KIB1-like n=1 Tax=Macadamia integrifolia TaxID=60698 RepID=UPI001C529C83|nr:F-box/kelch-repeat protein KIB1-like [Macadamia integrifolia]